MIKLNFLFVFVIIAQNLVSQNFSEATPTPPFEGVATGSTIFFDVNEDGYNDVFISGDSSTERIAKLYINDGMGNFSEAPNASFDGVFQSSAAFSDVNEDGYEDILVTGMNNSDTRIAKLYTNDGAGNFTELLNTPFDGVFAGSIAFSDVNGDGYDDILITGDREGNERIAKLYTNDGLGNFSEVIDTPFEGVAASSVAFSDVNGDNFVDVIISGFNNSDVGITKMYTNDGLGNFTEVADTPFEGIIESSIAFSDINGDGYEDVYLTGLNSSNQTNGRLYVNDGVGNFTEIDDIPIDGVTGGAIAFSDINEDGVEDLLVTGLSNSNQRIAKIYTNDGTGSFSELMDTPFEGVVVSSAAISDVNNNGRNDVLIAGFSSSNEIIAKLYINDGPTSIDDLSFASEFDPSVYPNPTTSAVLNVDFNASASGLVSIKICDENGKLLSINTQPIIIGKQTLSIDILELTSGNYYLQLETVNRKSVSKFIIQ